MGTALFELVTSRAPGRLLPLGLRVQRPARAFYRRRGCLELERTDGAANEERAPDIRVAWPGADPLAFLRGLIDEVDLVLGDVLARRTALTRAVQAVKPSGERDAVREAEIARRVAAVAPELGEERVARIVDVIITESLDASGPPRRLALIGGWTVLLHDDVIEEYRDFATYAAGDSPCFEDWALGVAGDQEVLAWLATLPPLKRQPNLVFAAARWHGAPAPGPYAGLRRVLLEQEADGAGARSWRGPPRPTRSAGSRPWHPVLGLRRRAAGADRGRCQRRAVPVPGPLRLRLAAGGDAAGERRARC